MPPYSTQLPVLTFCSSGCCRWVLYQPPLGPHLSRFTSHQSDISAIDSSSPPLCFPLVGRAEFAASNVIGIWSAVECVEDIISTMLHTTDQNAQSPHGSKCSTYSVQLAMHHVQLTMCSITILQPDQCSMLIHIRRKWQHMILLCATCIEMWTMCEIRSGWDENLASAQGSPTRFFQRSEASSMGRSSDRGLKHIVIWGWVVFLPFCLLVLLETFYLPLSFVHCTTVAVIQFCDFDEILLPSSFCIILCILHFKKFNQMCINQPFWENKVCNNNSGDVN